jgi:hypothetical protein
MRVVDLTSTVQKQKSKLQWLADDLKEVEDYLADKADWSFEPERICGNEEARLWQIVNRVRHDLRRA